MTRTLPYTQALMWVLTGNETFARNAIGILEVYANTVTSHVGLKWYRSVWPLWAELMHGQLTRPARTQK
jgi:hypothetical protein